MLTVIALVIGPIAAVGALFVATATPAAAVPVTIGTVQGQLRDQTPTSGNCITYAPNTGSGSSSSSSAWVTSPSVALTGHGYNTNVVNNCNGVTQSNITTAQSALGFQPTTLTTVNTGTTFLLGQMRHYNNPVQVSSSLFDGNLAVQLASTTLTFPWQMWETTNSQAGCPYPEWWLGNGNCLDQTVFTSQISDQTITIGGIQYSLVVQGFTNNGTSTSCPASPTGTYTNEFLTNEGALTVGCLYAQLSQIRTLTIVKDANAAVSPPATVPTFTYNTTSNLSGSPWQASTVSLTPTIAANASSTPRRIMALSETVTVTEVAPPTNWALTGLTCVDGAGATVSGVSYDLAARRVTLTNVPEATTAAAVPITCTFTNVYTSRATLSLVKTVNGGSATPADWTLTATRTGTPSGQISGPGNSAAVTNQSVVTGTWNLTETPSGSASAGYVQQGAWTCVNVTTGASVTVTDGAVTLVDGANVRCTVVNRYQTGTFQVAKVVDDPSGGYTGGSTKTFTGTYTCSNGTTGSFSATTATPWTSPQIPVNVTCTVVETQPTGGLLNASFAWGTPSVAYPGGAANVTITDGGNPRATITNTVVQRLGTVQVSKIVSATAPATAAGYTGGSTRQFPVAYRCVLTNGPTLTGTVNATTAGAVSIPNIPAGSVCTFTETLTTQAGDFADGSFSWTGYTFNPASVTVTANGVASTTVTNTFTRSIVSLTLAKVVSGSGYIGTGSPFEISYDCGAPYTGTVNLAAGGSQTVQVPANVQCRVVETTPDDDLLDAAHAWGTPTYDGLTPSGTITVPTGGTGRVTVTNPTVAIFGDVEVTKEVTGETAGLVTGTTFDITLTCSDGTEQTQSITAGGSFVVEDVPVGTTCSATEAALDDDVLLDDSYAWGDVDLGDTVTVVRDGVVGITVTNDIERAYGSLTVIKRIEGLDGLDGSDVTFTGTWTCDYGSGGGLVRDLGTWTITGAGEATLSGDADEILLNSTCSITENPVTTPPSATDPSYAWGTPQTDPAIRLTAQNPDGEIGVTNPIVRITAAFGVSKNVTGDTVDQPGYDPAAPFTFSYLCTDSSGEEHSGTLSVLPDGTVEEAADVPADSDCVVTETGRSTPIDPYRWDSITFTVTGATGTQNGDSVSFTTPTDGAAVVVNVLNVLEARTAPVVVDKVISGETGGFTGGTDPMFPITLVCDTGTYGPLSAAAGGSVSFDVPLGAECTVNEGAFSGGLVDDSYAWGTPGITPTTVTVGDSGASATVDNPITRVYAPVALTKIVDTAGFAGVVDPAFTYSGTWSCTYGSDAPVEGTWTVDGAGEATLTGGGSDGTQLLLNSECTATEVDLDPPSADPSYAWETPEVTDAVVVRDGSATIEVTNTLRRDTADLVVSKVITGETDGYVSGDFPIGYQCSVDGVDGVLQGSIDVSPGEDPVALASDVPVGWTCVVSEGALTDVELVDSSYAWGEPVITIDGDETDSVTISEAGSEIAVEVTNPIERVLGTVEVVKELAAGTPDGVVVDGTVFSGTYTCVYGEGTDGETTYSGNWTITGTGTATLTGDTAIPLTSDCTVTEDELSDSDLVDDSWTWGEPVTTEATVASAQEPAQLLVTNSVERVYGGLTITKVYDGDEAAFDADLTVTGTWACYVDDVLVPGGSGTWELSALGGTVDVVTPEDAVVPATASCRVTEDTLDDADLTDASWTWLPPTFDPEGDTPFEALVDIDANAQVEATVTNDTERVYGDISVTKTVTGPAVLAPGFNADAPFTGTYSCTYGSDDPVTGVWGPITTGQTQELTSVAYVGSVCTITEDAPTSPAVPADSSFIWLSPNLDPDTATVVAGEVGELAVENPTQRITGSFAVAKAPIEGASDAAPESGYDFSWTCTARNGEEFSGDLEDLVAGGDAGQVFDVPIGSTCTVTEGDLPAVDPPFSWGEPSFDVSGVGEDGGTPVDGGIEFMLPTEPDEPVVVTATNTLNASAEVEKTFDGADQHLVDGVWDGTWDLAYTIEVSNPSAVGSLEYSLTDTVDYGDTTVNSGSATSDATGTVEWDDVSQPFVIVPADDPITLAGGGTDVYDVVVNVTADPEGTGTIAECEASEGGLLNTAEVATGDVTDSDDACGEIPGDPAVTVTKTVVGTPVQGTDGQWTITYEIEVVNTDPDLATRYDVEDELTFGAGIDIVAAAVRGPGVRPEWNGQTDTLVAQDQPLGAGASTTYEVVVTADVTTSATQAQRDCVLVEGESGTGFLNGVTVTTAAGENSAQACDVPVSPTIEKTFVAGSGVPVTEPGEPWDGQWALDYEITVTNPSETTALRYSLTDEVSETNGDVVSVEVSGGQLSDPVSWDGPAGVIIAADDPVELDAGTSDVYLVHVVVQTDGGSEPVECGDGEDGIVNTAAATSGNDEFTDDACGELPGVAELTLVKQAIDVDGDDVSDELAQNWELTASIDGVDAVSGAGTATGAVVPGDYALSEAPVDGFDDELWTAGEWACVDGEGASLEVTDAVVTVTADVTCTIVNTEGEEPPTPTEPPTTPTEPPTTPSKPDLPSTGSDVMGGIVAALALLLAGGGTLLIVRRRRAV